MNENPSRRVLDLDDLWDLWALFDRAEEQMPESEDYTSITPNHSVLRRNDDTPVTVVLPYRLVRGLKSAIDNMRNGDDPREVLGFTRGPGKQIHSVLEQDRRLAIAFAYDVALVEYGDSRSRLELATAVAESELCTLGRDNGFTPRHVQQLHRKYGLTGAKRDRNTLAAFRELVESVLIRLRERLEE